jgi:hypothetical protein
MSHFFSIGICLTLFHVVDYVDLPRTSSGGTIEFHETWEIRPEIPAVIKTVQNYILLDQNGSARSMDSLLQQQGSMLPGLLSYEFMLLDPHVQESGNLAFAEADSMDAWTRNLQSGLIDLVEGRITGADSGTGAGNRYDFRQQLLSVIFHEEWQIDPATLQLTRKVRGVTPVIWQRRMTEDGVHVNDAETGLPVYYKNPLKNIQLRNPK